MELLPQLLINSLVAAAVYALVAVSFSLVYGATKFFNLAHGVLAGVGGYAFFYAVESLRLGFVVSLIVGVAVGACVGFGMDWLVYRPLRRRRASNMVMLVASLGVFSILQAGLAIFFTSQFRGLASYLPVQETYEIGGAFVTQIQIVIFALALLLSAGLGSLLWKTRFGRAVRAVSDDEEVAKIVGVNTDRVIAAVFALGAAITALSGILVGFDTGLEPTMGMKLLLKGVIAAIIGGAGSISGALLGAALLGLAENFGIWKISGQWKDAIAFMLLIAFLIFRPQGIVKR